MKSITLFFSKTVKLIKPISSHNFGSIDRYVLDDFPKTLKQAELMGSRSIIPMIVVELELDTVEVLRRGLVDKMKPNKSENTHR